MYGLTWFEILFSIFLLIIGLALEFGIDVWRERRYKAHVDRKGSDAAPPDEPHIS